MTIIIPALPPSLNEYLRMHYGSGRRWAVKECKQYWQELVMVAATGIERLPIGRKRVTITLCYSDKRSIKDADNAIGGCKLLIDALRYRGLIEDDNPLAIELSLKQVISGIKQTIVEIEVIV